MALKIEQDLSRFRNILRGQIKKELRKFITQGELIGKKGGDLVSIPLPQIEIPRFVYGEKQAGGVGQGEGEVGKPLEEGEAEEGAAKAGNAPGTHINEVEISFEELAAILGEELELPKILPKGEDQIFSQRTRYTSVAPSGPESLRHFKRTYRKALKRQILSGTYDAKNPKIIPMREDRVYRTRKEVRKPMSKALVLFMLDVSGCHTAGHFVEMANGSYKDIKDIVPGDWVCSIDLSERKKVHGEVKKIFRYTVDKTVAIQTEDHVSLRVTPNHRYFVFEESNNRIVEKRADALQEGDLLVLVNQFGRSAGEGEVFEKLSEAQSYLLGVILGDGFISTRVDIEDSQKNSRFVMITDEDVARLQYYADCAATAFGVRGLIRERSDRKRLYLNSAPLVEFLSVAFPSLLEKSRRRFVERSIFWQPPSVRAAFLRGFFDAEGTISDHAVEFLTSSLVLAKQIKLMLSYWGIRARMTSYWQKSDRLVGTKIKEGEYYRLILNAKQAVVFAKEIGFACKTKQRKLEVLVAKENKKTEGTRSRYIPASSIRDLFTASPPVAKLKGQLYDFDRHSITRSSLLHLTEFATTEKQKNILQQTLEESFLICRVYSVRSVEEETEVYDFETGPFHNYLIDGILSHNSMGNEQKEIVRIETFWIDTWLRSQYSNIDARYIIHDAVAREVDRETFFHTRESGGTIISSAYKLCLKIIEEQYNLDEWNIYPFHFSDGDNWSGNDTEECLKLLEEKFFPLSNVFCYGQVESEYGSGQFLKDLSARFPSHEQLIVSKIPNKEAVVGSIKDFLGKGK